MGREGDESQALLCGGFQPVHGKLSCSKWRMGVLCRAPHGGIVDDL